MSSDYDPYGSRPRPAAKCRKDEPSYPFSAFDSLHHFMRTIGSLDMRLPEQGLGQFGKVGRLGIFTLRTRH